MYYSLVYILTVLPRSRPCNSNALFELLQPAPKAFVSFSASVNLNLVATKSTVSLWSNHLTTYRHYFVEAAFAKPVVGLRLSYATGSVSSDRERFSFGFLDGNRVNEEPTRTKRPIFRRLCFVDVINGLLLFVLSLADRAPVGAAPFAFFSFERAPVSPHWTQEFHKSVKISSALCWQ